MHDDKLRDLAVSESGFVFDPYSGATFSLNASGLAILGGLKDGISREELIADLKDRFEVIEGDLHRDIDEFIHLMRRHGLVAQEYELP